MAKVMNKKQVNQKIDHNKYIYVKPEFPTATCIAACTTCTLLACPNICGDCDFKLGYGVGKLVAGTIKLYQDNAGAVAIEAHWAQFPPSVWNYAMDHHMLDEYLVTVVECDAHAHYDELAEHSENAYYRNKETMAAQEIHL